MENLRDEEELSYLVRFLKFMSNSELASLSEEEIKESINKMKSHLDAFNPNLPNLIIEGTSIKLLTRLKEVGNEDAGVVLDNIFEKYNQKYPLFWILNDFGI